MSLTVAIDARLVGGTSTGDSTYWTGLVHGFAEIESDLQLLFYSNAPCPAGIPLPKNSRWIVVPARSGRWWSMVAFPAAAKRAGARVLHTQYNLSPLVRRGGITTIHDVSFFIGPEWFGARDLALLQRFVPSSAKRAERVIAVSESSKREIEHYIPAAKGKVRVTYNATPPWIEPIDREKAQAFVQEQYGVERRYLLTVGTVWDRKNFGLALEAAKLVAEKEDVELVVTGKGSDQTRTGFSRPTGYVPNEHLSYLYSGAQAYLAPSRHEGFGIPLLEAFRCGCPVVCSSGGALPEVAGDAAVVMQSWEPAAWAEAVLALLADSSKMDELRRRGRAREAQFSWVETARKTLDVYREVGT